MSLVLDLALTAISLVFLSIVGMVTAVAIPGLFMVVAAPWLDWLVPFKRRR